jgi:hypothetical protein
VFEGFTVTVSVVDVVTDFLVLIEMHDREYWGCFVTSLIIFLLAHVSYAMMFVCMYANKKDLLCQVAVFVAVLPLAQVVPLFTWLEAFKCRPVNRLLDLLGLEARKPLELETDQLLTTKGLLEEQLYSHIGFIIEAFVEAIPQAILTTVFIVISSDHSTVAIISVATSIITIASKTYMLGFALDGLTVLASTFLMVSDCFGLFATVTLLAVHLNDSHDPLPRMLITLGASAFVSCFAFVMSCCLREQVHTSLVAVTVATPTCCWPGREGLKTCADACLWLFVLLPVPVAAALASVRMSLVSIFMQGSFMAVYCTSLDSLWFFSELVRFVRGSGHASSLDWSTRLHVVNSFLQSNSQASASRDLSQRGADQFPVRFDFSPTCLRDAPPPPSCARLIRNALVKSIRTLWKEFRELYVESILRKDWDSITPELRGSRPFTYFLFCLTWAASVACSVWAIVSVVALILLASVFPAVLSVPSCMDASAGHADAKLPCVLTASYVFSSGIACVLLLMNARRWSILMAFHTPDDTEEPGIPSRLMNKKVLDGIQRHYWQERGHERRRSMLALALKHRLGRNVANCVLAFTFPTFETE